LEITVYTTTTCPYCKMLKAYFDSNKVSYIEKLVDQDDNSREEMMRESGGFLGVPFTVIDKGGGLKETVVGFDKERLKNLVGIS
jgi:glutaredoxin 3